MEGIDKSQDTRNLVDKYKGMANEDIVADLDRSRVPVEVAIENLGHDFNIGTVVRNANAFNLARVHIIGKRKYNRRGAMVTDKYLHVDHFATVDEFVADAHARGMKLVAIENNRPETPAAAGGGCAEFDFDSWLRVGWYFAGVARSCRRGVLY